MSIPMTTQIERIAGTDLFDAGWYARTYPDVAETGMTPAEHYARYGWMLDRDPSPEFDVELYRDSRGTTPGTNPVLHRLNAIAQHRDTPRPQNVLFAAANAGRRRGWDVAVDLAERLVADEYAHAVNVLRANRALADQDTAGWLTGLNAFLAHWGADPLTLEAGPDPILQRLRAPARPPVTDGPLVSVLMPAWNAEDTIAMAVRSILDQSWRNLELIVVDDCSTDGTWSALQSLAAQDDRLRIHRNPVNVGPYVSKNMALTMAKGAWITGHDADDLALPDRLERQVAFATRDGERLPASLSYMVRLSPDGMFSFISKVNAFTPDGVTRTASISCLFDARFLRNRLGYWDSVRFGADSGMIARARKVAGAGFKDAPCLTMLCLDAPTSLTNDPQFGVNVGGGISPVRKSYVEIWKSKLLDDASDPPRLPFLQHNRRYAAGKEMVVPQEDVETAFSGIGITLPDENDQHHDENRLVGT